MSLEGNKAGAAQQGGWIAPVLRDKLIRVDP
jgi:hypothetical protein